ncbi:MAG: stage V sporulation protein AD, partial [Lachnospiraceae bacterium]|nr:stage V sporulation protein AD [Lachnospiraceae bacterium]
MNRIVGKQSMEFGRPIYIACSASVVGKKEGEGPLGQLFDRVGQEDMFGATTWEEAE